MKCNQCGFENTPDMKFCGQCGSPLGNRSCSACGKENDPDSRFCEECGEALITQAVHPGTAEQPPKPAAYPQVMPAGQSAMAEAPIPPPPMSGKKRRMTTWLWIVLGLLFVAIIAIQMFAPNLFAPKYTPAPSDWYFPTETQVVPPPSSEYDEAQLWVPYFTVDQPFPADYWSEGNHFYYFIAQGVDCNIETAPVNLDVNNSATLYSEVIYLRPTKLSQEKMGGSAILEITSEQETIPNMSFLTQGSGYPRPEAQAVLDACTVSFCWDDEPCMALPIKGLVKWTP